MNLPPFTAGAVLQLVLLNEMASEIDIIRATSRERIQYKRTIAQEIQSVSEYLRTRNVNPEQFITK